MAISDQTDQTSSAPNTSDPYGAARQRILGAYKTSLGRDASQVTEDEINSHLYSQYAGQNWATPGFLDGQMTGIANSDEAKAYKLKQAQPTQTAPVTPPVDKIDDGGKATPVVGSPVTPTGTITPQTETPQAVPDPNRTLKPVDISGVPSMPTYTAKDINVPLPNAYQAGALNVALPADYQKFNYDVPIPTAYAPGTLAPAYQADQISQFKAPDQSAGNAQQSALMQAILANPDTMNPAVVAQLQEANKEQALSMRDQLAQGVSSNAAARGTLGSGANDAQIAGFNSDAISKILAANRNVDIQAASTNRGDELNALNSSEAIAQGQLGRASQGFTTGLAGQTAQASTNQTAAASALQRAIAGESDQQAAAASRLAGANLGLDVQKSQASENQNAFADALSKAGLDFNVQNANQTNAQAAAASGLSRAGLDLGVQNANADQSYKAYTSDAAANQSAVDRLLSQFGINKDVSTNAQTNFTQDLSAELGRKASTLDMLKFLESQRQFNDNLGFNYNQLDQNSQDSLLRYLLGGTATAGSA